MRKVFLFLLVFWWSIIFPSLSFNSFTTSITNDNISYEDLYDSIKREKILENAEYSTWFFLSLQK